MNNAHWKTKNRGKLNSLAVAADVKLTHLAKIY